MKILIFTVDYRPTSGSGIATYTYQMARSLSQEGVETFVLAPHLKGDIDFDQQQGFKTFRFTNRLFWRELSCLFILPYLITRYRIDKIINLVWLPCGLISLVITRFCKITYFVVAHGCEIMQDLGREATVKQKIKLRLGVLKRMVFKYAQRIIAVSHYTKKELVKQGAREEEVFVLHCAVDLNSFKPKGIEEEIIKQYGLENKKVILTVSRLDDYKGIDMVIKALPDILRKVANAVYLVVGEGPDKNRLRSLVSNLGLTEKVIFVGQVEDSTIGDFFNLCAVFIMASREIKARGEVEGLGIVYLEAAAFSKPVVGGSSGGVPEAVVDGATGILVDALSANSISSALVKLLTDGEYAAGLGKRGRQKVEQDFSCQGFTARLEKIIAPTQTLIDTSTAPNSP